MALFPKVDEKNMTACRLADVVYEIKEAKRQNPKEGQDPTYIKHSIYVEFKCLGYQKGKVVPVRHYLNQIKHFSPEDETGKFLKALGWAFDYNLDVGDLDEDSSDISSTTSSQLDLRDLEDPEAVDEEEDINQPHPTAKEIEKFLKDRISKRYYAKVKRNKKGYAEFVPSSFKEISD